MFQLDYVGSCGFFHSIPHSFAYELIMQPKCKSVVIKKSQEEEKPLIPCLHVALNRFQMAKIRSFHLRDPRDEVKKTITRTIKFSTRKIHFIQLYSIEWFLLLVRIQMPWYRKAVSLRFFGHFPPCIFAHSFGCSLAFISSIYNRFWSQFIWKQERATNFVCVVPLSRHGAGKWLVYVLLLRPLSLLLFVVIHGLCVVCTYL